MKQSDDANFGDIEGWSAVDVVVVDRRRLVRDAVVTILEAVPGASVIATKPSVAELRTLSSAYDVIVAGQTDEPDIDWSAFPARIHRLHDEATVGIASRYDRSADSTSEDEADRPRTTRLTAREIEVLSAISDGLKAEDIARRMDITPKSVENHKQRIFTKLGVQSQTQAVISAQESGELSTGRRPTRSQDGPLVLVACPSTLLREITTVAVQTDEERVVTAASLSALTTYCRRNEPDIVISGTRFPDGDLLTALPDLLRDGQRVLVMADPDEGDRVTALLFAGASGCLLWQDTSRRQLKAAVKDIIAGRVTLHPAVAADVLAQWRTTRHRDEAASERTDRTSDPTLSSREAEVLRAISRGLSTKMIGRELEVSPKTVDAHVARLLAKLGVRTRTQAVSVARTRGLL